MIVVVDGFGANLASLREAFLRLEAPLVVTDDPTVIAGASRVILPGVGHAGAVATKLSELRPVLSRLTVPVLGICLGMQLFFTFHEEGNVAGLGVIEGSVRRLKSSGSERIPHTGWNCLQLYDESSPLLRGLSAKSHFYFVHSFIAPNGHHVKGWTSHGQLFPSVVSKDNWYGVQFHPEKSGNDGEVLIRNFLEL
jgi:glutamine amidotransferase